MINKKTKSLSRTKLPNRVTIGESKFLEQTITATHLFQIARTLPFEQKTMQTSQIVYLFCSPQITELVICGL
jgi:hypothetical protein